VIEIADVFRRFADGYLAAHGAAMPPSHKHAIAEIMACRTEALGGHVWRCDHCSAEVYSYHSCKNRSCPKCHTDQTERWLAARQAEVLPCRYFHVTVTVPEELRETLRANQKACYPLLMKAAGEAIIELARDRRYVGGTVGVLLNNFPPMPICNAMNTPNATLTTPEPAEIASLHRTILLPV